MGADILAIDTIETDDSYLIVASTRESDGNNDTILYSIKKDLKTKRFETIKKFGSGLTDDNSYRTVKISSFSTIGLIEINSAENEGALTLKFIVFDASTSNNRMVI